MSFTFTFAFADAHPGSTQPPHGGPTPPLARQAAGPGRSGRRAWRLPPMAWLACGAAAAAPGAMAAPSLNDTGQVTCLVGSVVSGSCAGTGQDADDGRDVDHPKRLDGWYGFRYAKVCNSGERAGQGQCPADPPLGPGPDDWACTKDLVSGLLWEVKTNDGGPRDQHRRYTNTGTGRAGDAGALVRGVNAAGLCGRQDWRLPERIELIGLQNFGVKGGEVKIDSVWFPNSWEAEGGAEFWSGTRYAGRKTAAWAVSFQIGGTHALRGETLPVRLTSGSKPWVGPGRWQASGDQVLDQATGLIWRRCAEGQQWSGSTCTGTPMALGWSQAVQWAQDAAAGGTPWRLPNVKELSSLVDDTRIRPALDPAAFPGAPVVAEAYWSSTGLHPNEMAWAVSFWGGRVDPVYTGVSYSSRLVRNAP